MDFRKQMELSGRYIQSIRKERLKVNQSEAAETAGIGFRTLQNIETGKSTSFESILRIINGFECSDIDVLTICGFFESDPGDAHDASQSHRIRLEKYINETYHFYFMNSIKEELQKLVVNFGDVAGYSYVGGTGMLGGQLYGCKLISPPDGDYTYLYFASSIPMVDRAIFVLPYHRKDRVFGAGIGIMLSISNEDPRCPTFQRFVVINKTLESEFIPNDVNNLQLLKWNCSVGEYSLRFPRLVEESVRFGERFTRLAGHNVLG